MQPPDDFLESNAARLVEAGLGGDARLAPELRQAMLRRLVSEVQARATIPPFPEKALGLLTALGGLAILGGLAQFSQGQAQAFTHDFWPILALLLLLNLALLPVASGVIVFYRRKHAQAD
jgi:hypothetical protein